MLSVILYILTILYLLWIYLMVWLFKYINNRTLSFGIITIGSLLHIDQLVLLLIDYFNVSSDIYEYSQYISSLHNIFIDNIIYDILIILYCLL